MTTPVTPDPSGLSGRTVSHFRVLEPLGAGGMGVVYRAEDVTLGRTVALKFMLPDYTIDDTAAARFLREARSVAALDHPNICTVHEAGKTEEGHLFLAMTYYPGETLKERLTRRGALPVDDALDIARQIARGLACAHAAGIVHRDLKPANVMLTADGIVKIVDFGLAKARDQTMTASGVVMGTVAYMSPEQLLGESVDARSDLWSLGVMLVEMLTGKHPSTVDQTPGTLARQIEARHSGLGGPAPTTALVQLVERLMKRNPADRYQNAADVVADVSAISHQLAVGATARPPSAAASRRNIALGIGAVTLVIAGILGVLRWTESVRSATVSAATATADRSRQFSLAVLPLKNYAGGDQDYFSDGMTEELISTLTKIESLRVIAHQSVLQFKDSKLSAGDIGRMLNVKYLLEGSVRRDSNRVKITARLIDAARNTPVWSNNFERDGRDVMALQRDVALAIAEPIAITLTAQDKTRLTSGHVPAPEAFELYFKGRQARDTANITGESRKAIPYLSGAIGTDPAWAAPYAQLALVYLSIDDVTHARALADTALSLDSTLAEGYLVRGMILQYVDWELEASEKAFREAIRFNHGFAEAHHELSMLLTRVKQFPEAKSESQLALVHSPMSGRFLNGLGEVAVFSGQYDEALAIADSLLAIDSTFNTAYQLRGFAFEQLRRWDDARHAWAACIRVTRNGCSYARARIGYIDGMAKRQPQARRVVDSLEARLKKNDPGTKGDLAVDIATVYMGLGDHVKALSWLEVAAAERAGFMLYLAINPTFRPLHGDSRFQTLLSTLHLPLG